MKAWEEAAERLSRCHIVAGKHDRERDPRTDLATLRSTIESLEAEKALYERALELACGYIDAHDDRRIDGKCPEWHRDQWADKFLTQAREEGK